MGDEPLTEERFLHDIKNPLSIAYGHCRMLLMALEAGKADLTFTAEKGQKIMAALDRLNAMIGERQVSLEDLRR